MHNCTVLSPWSPTTVFPTVTIALCKLRQTEGLSCMWVGLLLLNHSLTILAFYISINISFSPTVITSLEDTTECPQWWTLKNFNRSDKRFCGKWFFPLHWWFNKHIYISLLLLNLWLMLRHCQWRWVWFRGSCRKTVSNTVFLIIIIKKKKIACR